MTVCIVRVADTFLCQQVTLLSLTPAQSDDAENADRMYDLIGVVVHCGR